jgi:hypothetical protein
MKITKVEKIWLSVVIFFYIAYNLPFIPAYKDAQGTLIHALITLIPLWISIYVGLWKVCRIYRLKDTKQTTNTKNASTVHTLKTTQEESIC